MLTTSHDINYEYIEDIDLEKNELKVIRYRNKNINIVKQMYYYVLIIFGILTVKSLKIIELF
jgi:hypothetical protein